jgi:hypothetical protein
MIESITEQTRYRIGRAGLVGLLIALLVTGAVGLGLIALQRRLTDNWQRKRLPLS